MYSDSIDFIHFTLSKFTFYLPQSLLVELSELLNAFFVNFLLREQSGSFNHGQQLLTGEVFQVHTVQDYLLFVFLAILVFQIPILEKAESGLR